MATLSNLPSHLHEHARRMPEGLLRRLHPAEALHRLTHVHDTLRTAESLQAEQYRQVTAQANRELKAMPFNEFCAERDRIKSLRDSAANSEIREAWTEALYRLEADNPQAPGTGEAIMAYEKAQNVTKARPSRAGLSKAAKAELDKRVAKLKAEEAELRREIAEVRAVMEGRERRGQR
jgi:hypothetical protein